MSDELYNKLICALMHDLRTCDSCKKCEGKDFAEIRLNLVKELANKENKEVPWSEENDK